MSLRARIVSVKGLLFGLCESNVARDPVVQFRKWFRTAEWTGLPLANACTLATVTPDGRPDARMVLLKGVDEQGFVFFTNYDSPKCRQLDRNPDGVLVFHWNELFRQVRVEGTVERVPEGESDAYFATRPRGSQVGAWASVQSAVIPDRGELDAKARELRARYRGHRVPRPPFWGGCRLIPARIEFWQGRPNRLHDRLCFERAGDAWRMVRLSP
jgi:pyridoxamine 5'-phosphate oxidase